MSQKKTADARAAIEALFDEVYRLRGRILSSTRGMNEKRGLGGHSQSLILTAVVRAAEPPTVARIARSLGLTRQSVQRSANELAEQGFVAFEDNPHHKRAKQLVPTKSGLAAHASTDDIRSQWLKQVAAAVGAHELASAVQTLRRIRHHMERPGNVGAAAKTRPAAAARHKA